jgi:hypothetical protein
LSRDLAANDEHQVRDGERQAKPDRYAVQERQVAGRDSQNA